jgi:hypothetical protein
MTSHKSSKNSLAERDLKLIQLKEEIKKKKGFLFEKKLELEKNKDLNPYLEIINKEYSDFYDEEVNKKKKELHAMTILKDYIHFLEDQNHLANSQAITAKHDKKEILNEINKIKKELQKISNLS